MVFSPATLTPFVRIGLRYGVGLVFGAELGDIMAGDADLVALIAAGVAVAVELAYSHAKKTGLAT